MIKRCKVKAVHQKFGGLLVDEDVKWFNATKDTLLSLPDLNQFVGEEIDLYLVDGKDHTYSGIGVVGGGTEEKQQDNGVSSFVKSVPTVSPNRTKIVERFAALKCASAMLIRGRSIECYFDRAEKIIDWVMKE